MYTHLTKLNFSTLPTATKLLSLATEAVETYKNMCLVISKNLEIEI